MDEHIRSAAWRQFGASIDMLENAIIACPDNVWAAKRGNGFSDFWYMTFHTLFWLNFYLSDRSEESFVPPQPFGKEEFDPEGKFPPRVYAKEELLGYLKYCREGCRNVIRSMTADQASQDCGPKRPGLTNFELLMYNMRHVQHHTAQLNLILRQSIDAAPLWVSKTKTPLES